MINYYVVDVFTDKLFGGNPAGVCVLKEWPDDALLQRIAFENNLSETAFLIKKGDCYDLRWFTPELEIDLCGHATMGSAYVLFEFYERGAAELKFNTQSGVLSVTRGLGGEMLMDLPAWHGAPAPVYPCLRKAFGDAAILEVRKSNDILVAFASADDVRGMVPDFAALADIKAEASMPDDKFGVIITAPGDAVPDGAEHRCDFVSRYFAPNAGVAEDPATGRAHCMLTPYWSEKLGKTKMSALQLSKRGGALSCEDRGERVVIGGRVKLYLSGELHI